jgi:hypothetical protein
LKKDENALIKTGMNIRDESIFVMNEYNKKMMKMKDLINDYEICLDELNDAKLIIRELKVKIREKNLENSNMFLTITEDKISIATSKKLFDSFVFTDDNNLIIDD